MCSGEPSATPSTRPARPRVPCRSPPENGASPPSQHGRRSRSRSRSEWQSRRRATWRARPSGVGSTPGCATAPARSGTSAAGSDLTKFRTRPRRSRRGCHRRHDHIVCRRAVLRWRPSGVPWRFRRRSIVDRLTVRWSRPRLLARRPHGFPCPDPGGRSRPHCGQTRRRRHGHRRCHGLESRPPRLPQGRDRTQAPR